MDAIAQDVEQQEPIPPTGWHRRTFWVPELVTVSVGALSLVGFAARMGWRWELASHFRVQYFWLLVAAAATLLVCRRWKWAVVAGVIAAANLAQIAPLYFAPARSAGGERIRLMSANVYYHNRDFRRLLELVQIEDPDLLLLLEVSPPWSPALTELRQQYPHSRRIPRLDAAGIAFFSRVPVVELEFHFVEGMPTILARLAPESGPLTVIGAHPSSPGTPALFAARNAELAALANLAAVEAGPLVLVGDLNTTSWSPFFGDLLEVSGLRDSRRGFGVEPTWPGLPLPLRIPIDHCLVSAEVNIADRRVGPDIGSDHRPVIIDLEFGER